MTTRDPQQKEVMELRKWLDDNRAFYQEAMEIITDPKTVTAWLKSFMEKAEDIMRFDPFQHDATAAIGAVCAARERFGAVFEDVEFIANYQEKEERFKAGLRAIGGLDDDEPPAGAPDLQPRG